MARVQISRTDSASWDVKTLEAALRHRVAQESRLAEAKRNDGLVDESLTSVRRTDCKSLTLKGSGGDYAMLQQYAKTTRCNSEKYCVYRKIDCDHCDVKRAHSLI